MSIKDLDHQLQEVLRRADHIKEKRVLMASVIRSATVTAACLVLLILTAYYIPMIPADQMQSVESHYGSLLISAPYVGYVMIGLIAFALGVCVTLLCIHIKRMKEAKQE